ncbi:hypothetical protein NVP1063O_101 [Vibrio phage 1.063.O._10N.261.45.C7]|nr:hypothetical protein NVP1063O_101 [Vibrio phage 1.063.O._10N.261.45.C7]
MKTVEQLKMLGFREWNNTREPQFHSSWQLRVRDKEGVTKYFINVNLVDYFNLPVPDSWKEDLVPEYSVQFNNDCGTFDVQFFGKGKPVQDALDFYGNMFTQMNCLHYD